MGTRWSEAELELLRDTSLSLDEVAERTGRPYQGVANRAYRLGVRRYAPPSGIDWSDPDQVRVFKRQRYGKGSLRVPGGHRGGRRPGPPLSDEQQAILRDTSLTYAEVAERFGWASARSVEYQAKRLGVERIPDYQDWTSAELVLVDDLALTYDEVAQRLGRSRMAVKIMAQRRGKHRRKFWSEPGYQPGHNDYRGRGWKRLRVEVLERDGYRCREDSCGLYVPSGRGLVAHHVIPWRLREVNDLRWLLTLCRPCHGRRPEHDWREIPVDVLAQLELICAD